MSPSHHLCLQNLFSIHTELNFVLDFTFSFLLSLSSFSLLPSFLLSLLPFLLLSSLLSFCLRSFPSSFFYFFFLFLPFYFFLYYHNITLTFTPRSIESKRVSEEYINRSFENWIKMIHLSQKLTLVYKLIVSLEQIKNHVVFGFLQRECSLYHYVNRFNKMLNRQVR